MFHQILNVLCQLINLKIVLSVWIRQSCHDLLKSISSWHQYVNVIIFCLRTCFPQKSYFALLYLQSIYSFYLWLGDEKWFFSILFTWASKFSSGKCCSSEGRIRKWRSITAWLNQYCVVGLCYYYVDEESGLVG